MFAFPFSPSKEHHVSNQHLFCRIFSLTQKKDTASLTATQNLVCSSNQVAIRFSCQIVSPLNGWFQSKCHRDARVIVLSAAASYPEPSSRWQKKKTLTADSGAELYISSHDQTDFLWYHCQIVRCVCSAWPVCVLEHDKMGLYLWSYLFLQLYSSSRADAAFHPRGLMIIKEKGIRPVGVS